ncbi:MAG: cysteine desulfurase family protein [Planctomycetaceae bacterium]|nr:cysteine desulfurase family protein [Planctomycetaceae bacterium]
MSTLIDLDANATTRPLPEVIEVVARHLSASWGNPGSRHGLGRQARRVLEESRESIATILGAHPDEVLFTSGGTESNNTAIFGLARGNSGTMVISPGEHPANLEACRVLMRRGWKLERLPVDGEGRFQVEGLRSRVEGQRNSEETRHAAFRPSTLTAELSTNPQVAAVILAHNETGVIQDMPLLQEWCSTAGCPLHLDGVQAVGKIPVNFRELGATTLSFGAHKFHGPRGIGGLLIRRGTRLTPLLYGGHQEQERRPGTEAVPLIAGMARALELWQEDQTSRARQLSMLRDRLQQGLTERCAPVVVNSAHVERLPNTLNIAFSGLDGEALLVALDLAGVCCSLGTTCASGSTEPAPILVAMGCPPEVYRSSVRFSLSILNTVAEIDQAIERVARVVERMRRG